MEARPKLVDVAKVLRAHQERFQALDAFADDIDELRSQDLGQFQLVQQTPQSATVRLDPNTTVRMELFANEGIARFRLGPSPSGFTTQYATVGGALGGLLRTALSSASNKKEGLLGGLVLGMLVGAVLGPSAAPERVMALKFDPNLSSWNIYDGPLRRWAKTALHPNAVAV